MKTFTDQLDRKLSLKETPQRIVSLVPSQTELLVDLGLEENLIGITKFCVHPKRLLKEKKIVGGTKKVNYQKIGELHPDLILCNKEENTEQMVLELEKIAPVHVSDIKNVQDCLELVAQYGELFGLRESAAAICKNISEGLAEFQKFMENQPPLKVAYLIWKKPWMAAGEDTFINHLLEINNFRNVFVGRSRYPEISLEELQKEEVALVLLSTEPFPFREKHKSELAPFLETSRIEIVDGEYFSWYGSRLISAFSYFRSLQAQLRSF